MTQCRFFEVCPVEKNEVCDRNLAEHYNPDGSPANCYRDMLRNDMFEFIRKYSGTTEAVR